MPKYTPLETGIEFDCEFSDMAGLHWIGGVGGHLVADFRIPHDKDICVRIEFESVHILRVVDEMPLSTEDEPTRAEGLVRGQFAYEVEGSLFWETQSETFRFVHKAARHYRFITGWTCLDVIAECPPAISIVPSEDLSQTPSH